MPEAGAGSTGEHSPVGSSIVNLQPANADDRPTVIGPPRIATTPLLATGQTLGHFELQDAIGRGGMATVFKARDTELGRIVALKILPPEMADADSVSRFKQEARAAAKLDHDHVARVYFCGEDRGLHFIAFEYVPGETLKSMMEKAHLTPAQAVQYLLNTASGLAHAAERGVTHRDLKPSNIIITPDGLAKIVDMGLARHRDAASVNGGVTQSGVTLGTFDYISPEQALDPRRADVRSDIYSLGCTFYHAITGRPPVPEGTAATKLQAHQQLAPIDPRDLNPAVPEALAAVLARMMAKNPEARYSSARELILDLQAAAPACGYSLEKPLIDSGPRPVPVLPEPRTSVPLLWLLAGSVAAIALALVLTRPGLRSTNTTPPWGDGYAASKSPIQDANLVNAPVPIGTSKPLATVAQFTEALKSTDAVSVRLKAGTVFDLSQIAEGTTFQGTSLTIEAEPGTPPVVKLLAAEFEDDGLPRAGSLTVRGCASVVLKGIDLRIAGVADETALQNTAIALFHPGKVLLEGCRLTSEIETATGLAVVTDRPADISLKNCLIAAGLRGTGVSFRGPVHLDCDESAFAAHESALEFETRDAVSDTVFKSCTFLLDRGCAIRSHGTLNLTAGYCLFANGDKNAAEPVRPATDAKWRATVLRIDSGTAKYSGAAHQPNGYYQVNAVVQNDKVLSFSDVAASVFQDANARSLPRWPWASSEPRSILSGLEPGHAFRLTLQDSRLRLPPSSAAVILGAKSLGSGEGRIYPGAWPPERPFPIRAAANERVVWAEADAEDVASRIYPNFNAAFTALQPGETLLLAVNGPVPVPLLAERSLKSTIAAAPGYKPILIPEGPSLSTDSVMIRLAEGELTFERVEIRLKDRQAIVSVAGRTSCQFKQCVLTLVESETPMAVAVIPDAAREMRLPGVMDEPPRIAFSNTIIRGTGRGIWVQSARAFDVSFDHCAMALDGTLMFLESAEKTGIDTPRGRLGLKSSTIVVDDSLLEMKAGRTQGGLPTFVAVDTESCLIVAADSRSTAATLILIDDAESGTDPGKLLSWNGKGTVYSFADGSTAVETRSGDAMTPSWEWSQWLRFAQSDGKHQPRVRFARGSLKGKFGTVTAADFVLATVNPLEAGVSIEKLPQE